MLPHKEAFIFEQARKSPTLLEAIQVRPAKRLRRGREAAAKGPGQQWQGLQNEQMTERNRRAFPPRKSVKHHHQHGREPAWLGLEPHLEREREHRNLAWSEVVLSTCCPAGTELATGIACCLFRRFSNAAAAPESARPSIGASGRDLATKGDWLEPSSVVLVPRVEVQVEAPPGGSAPPRVDANSWKSAKDSARAVSEEPP